MSNDKYELLCQPTDDDTTLNKDKVLVPYKNIIDSDNEVSILTKKIITIILIILASIITIILFGILAKRLYNNYKKGLL